MVENCTLYCRKCDRREVANLVCTLFDNPQIEGEEDSWDRICVAGKKGELRLAAMVYRENGDEFTSLRFQTYFHANANLIADNEAQRESTLSHIEYTDLILGVVAEPGFGADPRFEKMIYLIAANLDALIFNGTELLNAMGEVVMYPEEES